MIVSPRLFKVKAAMGMYDKEERIYGDTLRYVEAMWKLSDRL